MIYETVCVLVGAFTNRLRGGGVVSKGLGTQQRRLIYSASAGLLAVVGSASDGLQNAAITGLLVFLIIFLMHLTGWGRPIGAVGGWEYKPLKEFPPFDYIADHITRCLKGGKQTWGFTWLTLWGLTTGSLVALAVGSIAPILSFGCMGLVYWFVLRDYQYETKDASRGWMASEWVYGAISFTGLS